MTEYLPTYEDGDPKEKLLIAFYKLEHLAFTYDWYKDKEGKKMQQVGVRMLSGQAQQL